MLLEAPAAGLIVEQPLRLFNGINRSKPWPYAVFIDLREEPTFAECHFQSARHLPLADATDVEAVTQAMHLDRIIEDKLDLFYVMDDTLSGTVLMEVVNLAQQWLVDAIAAESPWAVNWRKIKSVKVINFQSLYNAYPHCSSLYIGSKFPLHKISNRGKFYPTEIIAHALYLGSQDNATDQEILTHLGITHIVDATCMNVSEKAAQGLGLSYLAVPIWDVVGANMSEHFPSVTHFVRTARDSDGRVFIHCRAGISRSATLVLAYLMHAGIVHSLKDALELVMNERPAVLPNPSFRTQLLQYELSLFHAQSFEDEGKMQEFMASISNCWTKKYTPESDFDRTPVHGASQGRNNHFLQSEYPSEETATTQAIKPKKIFLKRGTGNTATRRSSQQPAKVVTVADNAGEK